MTEPMCTCHCRSAVFYRHLHAETCPLSQVGEEAPKSELQQTLEENAALRARLAASEAAAYDVADTIQALKAQLAETHAHLEAQRQETYRAVEREQAVKRQLAQVEQEREQLGRLVAAQLHAAEDIPRAAMVQYEVLKDVQAQLAAAQAEIATLKGEQL